MGRRFLSTIKGKIIVYVTLVMVISTAVNLYFTNRDVGQAMLVTQEKSARNILHSFYLVIREDYHQLLTSKRAMILTKRNQLKQKARMIQSVFTGFCTAVAPGDDSRSGIQKALAWINNTSFENTDFYIMDEDFNLISSSNKNMGKGAYRTIEDIKDRKIAEVMQFDNLHHRGDFAIFNTVGENGRSAQVLAFFLPFPPWKYTIGVSVDISGIEAQAQAEKENFIRSLNEYAGRLTITKSGFVCMVGADDTILIPPPDLGENTPKDIIRCIKEKTGIQQILTTDIADISEIRYVARLDNGGSRTMIIYSTYFRPLKWYTGVVIPLNEINAAAKQLVVRQSIIIGLMCIVGIIAVFVLVSRISKPLTLLSHYARRLPRRDLSKPLPEDSPIDELIKKHKDEVGALAASFVLMRRELNKNIQNLVQGTTARLRMESELNIAREIQLGMVPKTFPFFPDHSEFDLYATLTPAKEVGGDLYDFFLIDEDRLCFTLGDVSEKGVPSALFMVVIRTLIRTLSEKMESPGIVMEKINEILSADNPRSMFVKLVIGIFNFRTGEILYANGGHNPPVVMPCNSECYFKKGDDQPVVGAVPGISYTDISLRLAPQDSFFLYTDGVNEAMDADFKQFSSERQLAVLEFNKKNSAEQVINAVLDAVRKHAGNAVQSDDIAMLMIKYQGSDFI